jgi:hypothetical protein
MKEQLHAVEAGQGAAALERGQLVKVHANTGEMGGVISVVCSDEALVKAYDRSVGVWVTAWWPIERIEPMVTGMTAAESREIARGLLEQGKLLRKPQAATATSYAEVAA